MYPSAPAVSVGQFARIWILVGGFRVLRQAHTWYIEGEHASHAGLPLMCPERIMAVRRALAAQGAIDAP